MSGETICNYVLIDRCVCVFLCASCRATAKGSLSFSSVRASDSSLWSVVASPPVEPADSSVSVRCQRKKAHTAKRSGCVCVHTVCVCVCEFECVCVCVCVYVRARVRVTA